MYSLDEYKLTLPIDDSGNLSGAAHTIYSPEVNTYEDNWFSKTADYYQFNCPNNGATTATSSYSRCELASTTEISHTNPILDVLKFSVEQLTVDKKVTLHQLHGGDKTWYKLIYRAGGNIRAFIRPVFEGPEITIILDENAVIGKIYNTAVHYDGDCLSVYLDEKLVCPPVAMSRTGTFKLTRGSYFADNSPEYDECIVRHY